MLIDPVFEPAFNVNALLEYTVVPLITKLPPTDNCPNVCKLPTNAAALFASISVTTERYGVLTEVLAATVPTYSVPVIFEVVALICPLAFKFWPIILPVDVTMAVFTELFACSALV